jgi:lysophospholipase L1-like esterase
MKRLTIVIIAFAFFTCDILAQKTLTKADSALYSVYYWHSKDMFENLPDIEGEIIFLGNSITDFGEWHEFFGNSKCLNRGISGDVTEGVLLRLDAITKVRPAKVFILIGINDLSHGKTAEEITANYELILKRIQAESPETIIYVESVLPVNEVYEMKSSTTAKTEMVIELNESLKVLACRYGCEFIDLFSLLADSENHLKKEYSIDGLHLNYNGYKVWVDAIKEKVN